MVETCLKKHAVAVICRLLAYFEAKSICNFFLHYLYIVTPNPITLRLRARGNKLADEEETEKKQKLPFVQYLSLAMAELKKILSTNFSMHVS